MNKFVHTLLAFLTLMIFVPHVFAGSMTIKIESPKSPTNQNALNINFVVLDNASVGPITAKCFKKGPSEGSFTQFGSDIAIEAGGNQANCVTNSTLMNTDGTYQFYVVATNGSETATSDTVSVEYKTGGPETPTNYSKEGITSCSWKIKFHTADDGKTVKVEIYRSENTDLTTDSGTRIGTVTVGSNADGEFTTDKPDCSKTYYYAIRAFDSVGNGSGVTGDRETHTVTTTVVSGTSGAAGAIPVGTNGNVLGTMNGASEGATEASGAVLGESASPSATPTPEHATYTSPTGKVSQKMIVGIGLGLIALGVLVWLAQKKKSE